MVEVYCDNCNNASVSAAKKANTSSFSIYTRSSETSTYFDIYIFVRNSGNVGIPGTPNPSSLLDISGTLSISAAVNHDANDNSLLFSNTLSDFKITLWSGWRFGIQSVELKYTS